MPSQQRIVRSRALLPTKSAIAILAAFVAIVAITVLSYRSLAARSEAAEAVNHANAVQRVLSDLLLQLKEAEAGQRSFLISGDERYLNSYEVAETSIATDLSELRKLTAGTAEHLHYLERIEPLAHKRLELLTEGVTLRRNGNTQAAFDLVNTARGRDVMTEIRDSIQAMLATEQRLLDARSTEWESAVRWSSYVAFGGAGVLVLVLLLVGFFASRDFRAVANEGWIRRTQVDLAGRLQGDLALASLGETVLKSVVPNMNAQVGAVYVTETGGLHRVAGHALDPKAASTQRLKLGDGLAGQAALDNRLVHVTKVPTDYLPVSSALGQTAPRELVILPASVDDKVQAVVELGFLHEVDAVELDALGRMSETIALAIRSARDRSRLEELLEETQRQAEELQAQQEELRVTNEELEQQSKALQLSQTQLENQQSELEQINVQLEEQSQSLERQRDELARAGGELQRSNEYKSQFLANMSHELRTPLNSSLILAKLLADNREGNLNEEQVKFASTIYSAGNDLLTLINDILDLSKIEAGMLEVRPEPIVLGRLLDDLTATFQPIAQQKHLELVLSLAPGTPESVESDSTRLQQILKNLLSNALKFTERGGVTLDVSAHGDSVAFAVRDTGIGIAPDQHELIFEAFRQADGASTRKFGGTGLGLSISRDLARRLGGDLRLDSAPGRGSTFTLTLPLRMAAQVATARSTPPPAARPATIARPAAPPVQMARPAPFTDDRDSLTPESRALLIVEDDVAFARVLYDLAHELEFQAVVAATAEDALALARQMAPSAIVLDVSLPDRSGLAVLDVLKRDARTRHVPVHIVSAHDYTRTALEMGAAGYALKPIQREQLVEAIKKLEQKFTHKLRRVLVVEDDPLLRESTARLLSTDDVQTIPAGTSAEALQLLESQTFDCMVLDLALPDRSGLELLEEISHGEKYSFPPVIVYTGRSLNSDQVHELEKFSRSIIIKGARSPERLLDEVTLFLHQVEADLPPERQRMLRDARDREAVFEGKRIMIVEDDVRNVFALSAVLEPKGAKVVIARNGREAIDQLRANPNVDLVLMDIMMPEMDGIEATKALRADPQFARLPIIALTAKAMIDDREKCLDAGANDYIAKPLDVDKLLSLARVWIRK
ncbi:MAG: response regulator [Kofleriaceae bacterium]|nr:response regulator [Kofleriaceae bacterium]